MCGPLATRAAQRRDDACTQTRGGDVLARADACDARGVPKPTVRVEIRLDVIGRRAMERRAVAHQAYSDVVRRHRRETDAPATDVHHIVEPERDPALGRKRSGTRQDARRDRELGGGLLSHQHVRPLAIGRCRRSTGRSPSVDNLAMAAKEDELARRVERLAGVGFCSTPSFSPDGSRIAFISDLSGTPQVWTVATGGGWPQRVTAFPDQVTNARWSPGGELIAVEVAPGGGLNQQVYVLGPDGSGLKLLTPGGDENNRLSRWSRDGRTLFVVSNRDDPAAFDTFAVDVAAGSWKKITKTRGITTISDTSADGTKALITRSVARGNSDAYLIDLASGEETLLTPHEGQSSFFGPRFGADGAIWLDTDDGREHSGLARIELAGGRPRPLEYAAAREDAELEGAVMDDAGSRALLVWNHAGRSELEWFDVKTRARSAAPSAPAEIVAGVAWSPRGDPVALACTGSAAPVDIWTLSPDSPTAAKLTASAHPGIGLSALVP